MGRKSCEIYITKRQRQRERERGELIEKVTFKLGPLKFRTQKWVTCRKSVLPTCFMSSLTVSGRLNFSLIPSDDS